jgi:hypothetical protein
MAWNFLAQLAFYVGTYVVSALLNKATAPATPAPGEVQFPRADSDAPIPVIYGTTRVGLNVVHKVRVQTGTNAVRGSAPFGWAPQSIGYFYYLDALAVVGWGTLGALHDVIVDGTKSLTEIDEVYLPTIDANGIGVSSTPTIDGPGLGWGTPIQFATVSQQQGQAIVITAGNILGGKFGRGGVGAGSLDAASAGVMRVNAGSGVPESNSAFETIYGSDLPTYPNLITVAFESFYMGNSESLPAIELVVSRAATPFGGTGYIGNVTANGAADANPALVLYDLLTNTDYGLGLPPSDISTTSFSLLSGACDTLFGGAFDIGVSFVLTEQAAGKTVIADLLRTLDGVLYLDPTTAQLSVRLIRASDDPVYGYGGGTVVDESSIIDGTFTYNEQAASSLVNEVKVQFIDKERNYTSNVVTVRNAAAVHALGRTESRTVRFLGVQNKTLATRLAQRELLTLSANLSRGAFEMTRAGYSLTPGQPFTLSYAPEGITSRVVRVVSVRDTPHGTVALEWVDDIYASDAPSFEVEDTPEPTPPDGQPSITPSVETYATQTTTTGTLKLFVLDVSQVVTSVEFQTTSGTGTPSGYATDAYPYAATVTLDPYAPSTIDWRVNYTDAQGDAQEIEGTVTFGIDPTTLEETTDTVSTVATTVGSIGIPTVFVATKQGTTSNVPAWDAFATIPTAEVEAGTEYRRQRYAAGAGSVRFHANIKTLTGTPTLKLKYTTNAFGAVADLLTWTPAGTGLQSSGFAALPSGAKADIGLTWYLADGADTAAIDLYHLEAEFVPTTVSGARIHTDDHAPEFY